MNWAYTLKASLWNKHQSIGIKTSLTQSTALLLTWTKHREERKETNHRCVNHFCDLLNWQQPTQLIWVQFVHRRKHRSWRILRALKECLTSIMFTRASYASGTIFSFQKCVRLLHPQYQLKEIMQLPTEQVRSCLLITEGERNLSNIYNTYVYPKMFPLRDAYLEAKKEGNLNATSNEQPYISLNSSF